MKAFLSIVAAVVLSFTFTPAFTSGQQAIEGQTAKDTSPANAETELLAITPGNYQGEWVSSRGNVDKMLFTFETQGTRLTGSCRMVVDGTGDSYNQDLPLEGTLDQSKMRFKCGRFSFDLSLESGSLNGTGNGGQRNFHVRWVTRIR